MEFTFKKKFRTGNVLSFQIRNHFHNSINHAEWFVWWLFFTYCVFQHKCEQYWPEQGSRQFGELRVETKETEHFANFMIRVFELQKVSRTKPRTSLFPFFDSWQCCEFSVCSAYCYCKIIIFYSGPACYYFGQSSINLDWASLGFKDRTILIHLRCTTCIMLSTV